MIHMKRKNGMGFYRATNKGMTIKDIDISTLRENLLKLNKYPKQYLTQFKGPSGKSYLWYLNIKHGLLDKAKFNKRFPASMWR